MRPVRDTACAITATILATACGGGGGGGGSSENTESTNTATGVLKDANVAGLQYRSGSRSGTTDASGEFTYEVGETVTFFIGGVTVGTADGAGFITPIDLADGDSVSSTDVVNRVRFLLFLDSDGDPDNGIQISSGVRDVADNWNQVDFTSSDLDNELTAIASDVASIDGDATVSSADEAETHFSGTLRCLLSGAFAGVFDGDRDGRFAFLVSAFDGEVNGGGYSDTADNVFTVTSNSAVTLDTERRFVTGGTSGGAEYSGRFDRDGNVAGDWEGTLTAIAGTFNGSRIAGEIDADYRFAGTYEDPDADTDAGIYAMDINGTDVSGTAYSVVTGETEAITGNVSDGTDISATTASGTSINGTIGTELDALSGSAAMSGTWSDGDGDGGFSDGGFSGDGCRLN